MRRTAANHVGGTRSLFFGPFDERDLIDSVTILRVAGELDADVWIGVFARPADDATFETAGDLFSSAPVTVGGSTTPDLVEIPVWHRIDGSKRYVGVMRDQDSVDKPVPPSCFLKVRPGA